MSADPTESFSRPRAAAGVLFFDGQGHVMLVVPSYKNHRDLPGGYIEHGETPSRAAAREVQEELGIEPPIGRLLAIDWAPSRVEGDKQLFIFDGGRLAQDHLDAVVLDQVELTGYGFHDVAVLHERTTPRLARRITHAVQARAEGAIAYLENGEPLGRPSTGGVDEPRETTPDARPDRQTFLS
ncbi:NUDIX domain-containing protein [Nocardiopsis ansamitocini]|uniref:NUDIX hydrolase n=1 Tax=Nocardiopsis ansamitocini TaxID=1670832 RepID=A0A9W6P7Z2_9ACTN|nr:NUDIX hydrolase [Nocardiopsis ansamitocini]GLU49184.1 NUDIX hydrolase [Nocardiopsis ansamitocini]